jgi:hypothetical protein
VLRRSLMVVVYGWVVLNLVGLLAWWRWHATEEISWGFWLTCVLATFGLIPVLVLQIGQQHSDPSTPTGGASTPPEPNPPVPDPTNPYRGRLRTVVEAAKAFAAPVAASTSATILSTVVGGAMLTASLLVSSLLHLPGWVEVELILGVLWAIGVTVFTGMLWRGSRLEDDRRKRGLTWGSPLSDQLGRFPLPGCLPVESAVLLVLVLGAFAASFVFIELLLPAVFLVLYYSVFAGVGRVVNDRHGCEGRPLRALLWGAFWTTVYLAPVAVVVGLVGHAASLVVP